MFPPDDSRPFKVYEASLTEIAKTIVGHVLAPTQKIEPSVDYIIRSLRESASYVVNGLKHLGSSELETFFGGKNVFKNILEYGEGSYPEEDLRSAPIKSTRRTLRRPSGVNKIDITKELDYVIVEEWDKSEFNKLREATSHKLPSTFMEKFKRDVEARMGNFFIVRRLDLAAPNTYALAFFSNIECAPTKLVWSTKVPHSKLKLIAAFFNSTINLLQTLLSRAETRGSFLELSEYILVDFYIPNLDAVSQKDKYKIIQAFERMSKRPLSSLLNQIKEKDNDRLALDKAWLEALKYTRDIDKVLDWLYDAIANEIETLKTIMAEGHTEA